MENSSASTNIHKIEEADKLLENRIQGLIQILAGQVLVNGLQSHQDAVLLLEQINQEQTTGLYSYKNAEKLLR